MITVKEALELDNVKLSPEEEETYRLIEGKIDSNIYGYFVGGPFVACDVTDPQRKVVSALKRLYESGGWRVDVLPNGDVPGRFKLLFAPAARML